ncbi:MAG TPA: hypothetical protein VHS96_17135 [Bacteroidia bacterium]|nr:hypothetical protein [Bacteroidia bacterium]
MKEYAKRYYAANYEKIKARRDAEHAATRNDPVKWRAKLDDGIIRSREWRKRNPDKSREGIRRWQKSEAGRLSINASKVRARKRNPEIALKHVLRCRINEALKKGYKKLRSTRESLGCSIPELKAHLENLFQPGMTWENRGQWEIDHIRPCASFNLLDPEQQRCCFHFSNLQPLWKADNRRKSDQCL